ncbi:MAG: xanthine dehydrogenase family protein molybdopterin-binding subunit [Magnetospirillum sp.]|nr:xanthine dehydrogenase family protein molybdopterin-binding subunit [Magnetospirillum sp.]
MTGLPRRRFLQLAAVAGAGLAVGVRLGGAGEALAAGGDLAPNAFVRVDTDGTVTVVVKHLEMGQGVDTGLPAIVAEELSVPWPAVRVVSAPADSGRYNNLLFGTAQGTGGSTSMANSWLQLRKAAAAVREMLCEAGARRLGVPRAQVDARQGRVADSASGKGFGYGALVDEAATLPVPQDPPLKDSKDFTLIGKDGAVRRTDATGKTDGSAVYGADVILPDMVTAVVARPPTFGATLARFDDSKARAVPGVRDVVAIPSGVAVVADDTWSALKGREALRVEWRDGAGATLSTDAIRARYAALLEQPGLAARREGDADAALAASGRRLSAVYEVPYLAHAPMEPLSCAVRLGPGRCEIWAGCQSQTSDQAAAAKVLGLQPQQVAINTLFAGGSFGRRANPTSDYIVEAVEIAKRADGPVRLVWTREDDIQGGYYRAFFLHGLDGALDAAGNPVAWRHRLVGQSIAAGTAHAAAMIKDGIDRTSVEGASTLPYAIPNLSVELHSPALPVTVLWWRSVGSSHNGFVTESFLDEMAHAAGRDPLEFRRALLGDAHPRHRAVLDLAAEKAGWGSPLPAGRGRGIAVHESFRSFVAQVAEVSVDGKGGFTVDRVVCAVDCGIAVTPDVVRAQMEGGIAFGLSAALYSAVTLRDGRVGQSNFHDYPVLRMSEMPAVEVHIVPSAEPPTGVGEPGVPPIAPAVANALFAATGRRIRTLPFGGRIREG